MTFNHGVEGSSPSALTNEIRRYLHFYGLARVPKNSGICNTPEPSLRSRPLPRGRKLIMQNNFVTRRSKESRMVSRWVATYALVQVLVWTSAAFSQPVAVAPKAKTPAAAAASTATQRVRMAIATFLEGNERFRKHDNEGAPKLAKAVIAGPADYKGVFSNRPPVTVYCVQVDLVMTNPHLWATHDYLSAVITFPPSENGSPQRIHGVFRSINTLTPSAKCADVAPYTPFPELEQLRARRRHALGKPE